MSGPVLRRLGIRSQLLLLLLAVGLSGIALAAGLAYVTAARVREAEVLSHLGNLRDAKATRLQDYFARIRAHVDTLAEDEMVLGAMQQFGSAYQTLGSERPTPAALAALTRFYADQFLPRLAANSGGRPDLDAYLPATAQARILQARYLLANPDAAEVASRGGSDYAALHARLDPVLHRIVTQMGYRDLLLISPDGNIVYTTARKPDFGTSLLAGPYADSSLARVFQSARRRHDRGEVDFSDYAFYAPSDNAPAAFFAAPLVQGSQLLGVLAVELSIDEVNAVLTGHGEWAREGFGATGEAYLVGDDQLLRSDSRFLLQDKSALLKALAAHGVAPAVVDRIDRLGTSILVQPVRTDEARDALAGQTGTAESEDYRGVRSLAAFRPAGIPGVNWGFVAKRDYDEAMAPVNAFKRQVALFAGAFAVLLTMLSLWLAGRFVRPIDALLDGVRRVGEGHEDVHVEDDAGDEIGRLARAFNGMVDRLRRDKEEIRRKNGENEALLLNVLPAPVAQRLKGGEERIADAIPNVTVLFADLVGFGEYSRATSAEVVVALLNEIVSAFDEAADRYGVERVKTIGSVYMAVSGLSVARIDHVHRMLTFAQEIVEILRRLNQRHGLHLELSIGINCGPAIAGIVGRQKFIYDLWGDTVTLAGRMERAAAAGIRVTQAVKEAVGDQHAFEPAGEFEVPGRGPQPIWALQTP